MYITQNTLYGSISMLLERKPLYWGFRGKRYIHDMTLKGARGKRNRHHEGFPKTAVDNGRSSSSSSDIMIMRGETWQQLPYHHSPRSPF